jgi:hypothetical protein
VTTEPNDPLDITQPEPNVVEERAKTIRAFLERRQRAYINVFREGRATEDDLKTVMEDLVWFCRGDVTPWADDARVHALITGRHEVLTRIRQHIDLPFARLLEISTTATPEHEKEPKK